MGKPGGSKGAAVPLEQPTMILQGFYPWEARGHRKGTLREQIISMIFTGGSGRKDLSMPLPAFAVAGSGRGRRAARFCLLKSKANGLGE